MTYVISGDQAVEVTIAGEPIDMNASYTLAISDYLAEGGDNLSMLKPIPHIKTKVLVREAILAFWRNEEANSRSVTSSIDGRVSLESDE